MEEQTVGESKGCGSSRCQVCENVENSSTFSDCKGKIYNVGRGVHDCNSENIVYLLTCRTCNIQYVGSCVTKFRTRFNNYKSSYRNFLAGKKAAQTKLHAHFSQSDHNRDDDWCFTLIESADTLDKVRRREAFWQIKLNTFAPDGLNERDVVYDYGD